jgi:dihydrofolate reductase
MSQVFADVGISLDGFMAGPRQSEEDPMGVGAQEIHRWVFETPDEVAGPLGKVNASGRIGAVVMGRNMFGPVRGPWESWSGEWRGWWGENPPYHVPVFVLTHFAREPLVMDGGTTFTFVTDGLDAAMALAREAAGELDIEVAGGASVVNAALSAGFVDELRLHIAPLTLGHGERLFDGVPPLRLEPVASRTTELVTHVHHRVLR